jgi:hypothetical protein
MGGPDFLMQMAASNEKHHKAHEVDAPSSHPTIAPHAVPTALSGRSGLSALSEQAAELDEGEVIRVVRRLRLTGDPLVGLVPADPSAHVAPVAIALGRVLAENAGLVVALIDAGTPWADAPPGGRSRGGGEHGAASPPGAGSAARFVERSILPGLSLLTPTRTPSGRIDSMVVEATIRAAARAASVTLVDLTGLAAAGEHLTVSALLDAVLIVARRHHTTEHQLLRAQHEIDPIRSLGVVLVG